KTCLSRQYDQAAKIGQVTTNNILSLIRRSDSVKTPSLAYPGTANSPQRCGVSKIKHLSHRLSPCSCRWNTDVHDDLVPYGGPAHNGEKRRKERKKKGKKEGRKERNHSS